MIRLGVFLLGMLALSATANLAFAQTPTPSPSAASTSTTPPSATPTTPPTVTRTPTPSPIPSSTTVPVLTPPTNLSVYFVLGSTRTEQLTPWVSWLAVPGAVTYELEMSATDTRDSRDFKLINLVPAAPTDAGYVRFEIERSFARQQCYRVRAVGASGIVGLYSEAFCLPLVPTSGPGATPLPPVVGNSPAGDGDGGTTLHLVATALLALSLVITGRALQR